MKTCSKCQIEKEIIGFHKANNTSDGLKSQCKICRSAYNNPHNQEYYIRTQEAQKAYSKEWRRLNKERDKQSTIAWRLRNSELHKKNMRSWQTRNADKCAAYTSKRRAFLNQAIPIWYNDILVIEFFEKAKMLTKATGIKHHVDHIVPINSKLVCGLHWHGNLQILPASENIKKSNRSWPDMP